MLYLPQVRVCCGGICELLQLEGHGSLFGGVDHLSPPLLGCPLGHEVLHPSRVIMPYRLCTGLWSGREKETVLSTAQTEGIEEIVTH